MASSALVRCCSPPRALGGSGAAECAVARAWQVRKYWMLAKMCNDVVVHASSDGFFIYLSPECKAKLGYKPHQSEQPTNSRG